MLRKKVVKAEKIDPTVKSVLILLGAGTFLAASIVFPGLPLILKPYLKQKHQDEIKEWKKFNQWRLRSVLKRMREQKLVEFVNNRKDQMIKITEGGKRRYLNYKLDEMELVPKWDGKWRLIVYDIPNKFKNERDHFRLFLKKMKFLKLQKSVYLTPYKCEDEIEYLRQVLRVTDDIKVLKVSQLENDRAYREYFGL